MSTINLRPASETRTTIKLPTWLYQAYKKQAIQRRQTLQEVIVQNLALALKIKSNLIDVNLNVSLDSKIEIKMPKVKYPETYLVLKKMAQRVKQKGKQLDSLDLSRETLYEEILRDRKLT